MKRHRTIHDKSRLTPYRINLNTVTEDVHILVDDEDGKVYYDKVIPSNCLEGISDLHFKFISGKVVWDKPSSQVLGE